MSKEDPGKEISESNDSSHTDEDELEDAHKNREPGHENSPPSPNVRNWKCIWSWSTCIAFFLTVALAVALSSPNIPGYLSLEEDPSGPLDDKIKSYVAVWRNGYPNQYGETWGTIAGQLTEFASIGHISPLVIVLAYDKGHMTTKLLASEISRAALQLINDPDRCGDTDVAKIFGGDRRIQSEFLLSNYTPQLVKCKKMLMFDLQKLDGSAAKDLHSLLDPDHPNIPNVVFIFTVKITNFEGNVYHEVRNTLTTNWSAKIDSDRLNALISRLVNNVKVIPEPDFE